MRKIGIDALSYYVPHLYLDLELLAQKRGIEYAKLNKGLGLKHMAVADRHEDAASFAANALFYLIRDNNIDPREIGRIYLGTESALDAAKPTATYAVEVVENLLEAQFGERCFKNCDILDMTFACVGAVDALHNSMDWVRAGDNRRAVVIASDIAKYELESTGEYTQGAGAVAMFVKEDPAMLEIKDNWGVASKSVGDFFKPRRTFNKLDLFKSMAHMLGQELTAEAAEDIMKSSGCGFWGSSNSEVEVFKEEPVFDGPYSNNCYKERIGEALEHFSSQTGRSVIGDWSHIVFHLPYAYQARRMFVDNWYNHLKETGTLGDLIAELGEQGDLSEKDWMRKVSKSNMYKQFVESTIEEGERASSYIGNMYTASIFMSLLSLLSIRKEDATSLTDKTIGFISYGSGSKSKVFEAVVQKGWDKKMSSLDLFDNLSNRQAIDIVTYENLHNNKVTQNISNVKRVQLSSLGETDVTLGLREYSLGQ